MPEAVRAKPQPVFGSFLAVQKGTRIGMRNIPFFYRPAGRNTPHDKKSLYSVQALLLQNDQGR